MVSRWLQILLVGGTGRCPTAHGLVFDNALTMLGQDVTQLGVAASLGAQPLVLGELEPDPGESGRRRGLDPIAELGVAHAVVAQHELAQRSYRGLAAVGDQKCAGDEAGLVGEQEAHRGRNLLRLGYALLQIALPEQLRSLSRCCRPARS